jgi:L-aminopeptidase/D-esterase-like protein
VTTRARSGTLTDVAGLRVGHFERTTGGWLSGTTVVVGPPEGVVASVDVRGGAPGTRETDLLLPGALVERVHAIVLTGGSAYGLAAASGVTDALGADGVGFRVGREPGANVPIVPAAVIFDLGRGGDFTCRPGPAEGMAALRGASGDPVAQGTVGAGTGARAGGLKGGIGSASQLVADTWTVAAMVVVNAAGSPVAPDGSLYAAGYATEETDPELAHAPRVDPAALAAIQAAAIAAAMNTTIGVVATDATLTKAECARLAMAGQDGIARAVRPSHLLVDGDSIFGLSTGTAPAPDDYMINLVLAAAADCVADAIGHGMLAATSAGSLLSFRDLAARAPAPPAG